MKKLLVPALFLAACADTPTQDVDQLNAEGDMTEPDGSPTPGTPGAPENPFLAGYIMEPNSCIDNSVRLQAYWSYADGTRPDVVQCRYTLLDGTVISDSCLATPSMPTGAAVMLTVTDPATGAVATHQDIAVGPESLSATVTASGDGLSISWDAHTLYGASADVASVNVSISPSEKVIAPSDPMLWNQYTGTVNVMEAGTYTVHVLGTMTFADVGGCATEAEATIEVMCDDPTHEH